MEHFCCEVCSCMWPLDALTDLDCYCSICKACSEELLVPLMQPNACTLATASMPAQQAYAVGQMVSYRGRDGRILPAKVVLIDKSVEPAGYGILLKGAVDIRFTEDTRLLPTDISSSCQQAAWFPTVKCPKCAAVLTRAQLARILPDALQQLDDDLTNSYLEARGIIRCPTLGCEALIEKLPATGNGRSSDCTCGKARVTSGSRLSSSSSSSSVKCTCCREQHMQQHRYRCLLCSQSFCDGCRSTPYHEGLTCQEFAAPGCLLCGEKVLDALGVSTAGRSNRQLQQEATKLGADCSWCLERNELVELYKRAKQVCNSCRPGLSGMCCKKLPCGHWCCGVRGTQPCLPCLQPGCASRARSAGGGSCCFCWEPLSSSPVIALTCQAGHFVHLSCARNRLQVGCPGPALTFDFLFCPLCGSGSAGRCGNVQVMTAQPHLQHDQLQAALQQPLQLRQQVAQLAKTHLKLAGLAQHDPDLQPGGKFDGRPADYALHKFQFYKCTKCGKPYFGGARDCGPAAPQQAGATGRYNAQELVCGSCSAIAAGSICPQHGSQYVEWKCKYCCNIAAWFCWGNTHMCSRCHDNPSQRQGHVCKGPGRCQLAVPHAPPGSRCCLGCGVCRHSNE